MKTKNKYLILGIILALISAIILCKSDGVSVLLSNEEDFDVKVKISCRGFLEEINLKSGESDKVKIRTNFRGDNFILVEYKVQERIIKKKFSYFTQNYSGEVILKLEGSDIIFISESLKPTIW